MNWYTIGYICRLHSRNASAAFVKCNIETENIFKNLYSNFFFLQGTWEEGVFENLKWRRSAYSGKAWWSLLILVHSFHSPVVQMDGGSKGRKFINPIAFSWSFCIFLNSSFWFCPPIWLPCIKFELNNKRKRVFHSFSPPLIIMGGT